MTNKLATQTPTRHVDVAIIGAGTAGQVAFKKLQKSTCDIVIINEGYWTTTCATVGCMPSKLMIAAAERAHHASHSAEFGINAQVSIDAKAVMQRVRDERDRFVSFVDEEVASWDDSQTIDGCATILGQDDDGCALIGVNDDIIAAKSVVIATGSTPTVPSEWKKALGGRLLTSDNVFELTDLPQRLAVIGGGAIGLELAQAMVRLGVEIKLFNRQVKLGGIADDAVNDKAIEIIGKGLDMALGSEIQSMQLSEDNPDAPSVMVNYVDSDGKSQQFNCDYVLVAIGRQTHLKKLGVESIGIALDEKGNPLALDKASGHINGTPHFVVGDANSYRALLHIASDEGYNAAVKAAKVQSQGFSQPQDAPRTFLAIVFSEPNIAQVGDTLTQLQEKQDKGELKFVTGKVSFENQGRSRVMGMNDGLLHVYACYDTGKILGACMVAPHGEYLAHLLALAMTQNMSVAQMLDMPFYHPTIVEGLRTALRDANRQVKVTDPSHETRLSSNNEDCEQQ